MFTGVVRRVAVTAGGHRDTMAGPQRRKVLGGVINEYHRAAKNQSRIPQVRPVAIFWSGTGQPGHQGKGIQLDADPDEKKDAELPSSRATQSTPNRQRSHRPRLPVCESWLSRAARTIVVIMFENRSLDNLLGRLYQPRTEDSLGASP